MRKVSKEIAGSGPPVLKCGLTSFGEVAILTPMDYAPKQAKRFSMMSGRNTLLLIVGICVFIIIAWTFNPMLWRVQSRFPSAKVSDLYESPFVPAVLQPYVKFSDDLYEGRYFAIEISDATVDLNKLRGIPWCFLRLHRCRISDLSLLKEMNIFDSHCDVSFDDCDVSAVPRNQFAPSGPPPLPQFFSFPADPKHFSSETRQP